MYEDFILVQDLDDDYLTKEKTFLDCIHFDSSISDVMPKTTDTTITATLVVFIIHMYR